MADLCSNCDSSSQPADRDLRLVTGTSAVSYEAGPARKVRSKSDSSTQVAPASSLSNLARRQEAQARRHLVRLLVSGCSSANGMLYGD